LRLVAATTYNNALADDDKTEVHTNSETEDDSDFEYSPETELDTVLDMDYKNNGHEIEQD
jgi:hypothetical protein